MPIFDTRALNAFAPAPGWEGRYFHTLNATFVHYRLTAGASIHAHAHPNEETWQVLAGELEISARTRCSVFGGTTAAKPGPATRVSASTLISSSPARTCHVSSLGCACAWSDAPAVSR